MSSYKYDKNSAHNYSSRQSYGYPSKPLGITIHHWGSQGQHHLNVANYLAGPNKRKVSAHEVISSGWVTHLVSFYKAAWHAGTGRGNGTTIGLECKPEMSAGDFNTLIERCVDIEEQVGSMRYYGHRDWLATACPGKYYKQIGKLVKAVNKEHKARGNGKTTIKPSRSGSRRKPAKLNKMSASSYPSKAHPSRHSRGPQIKWLGNRLKAHGFTSHYRVGPGPNWSGADRKNLAAFQRAQGWSGSGADGYPGPKTLQALAAKPHRVRKSKRMSASSYPSRKHPNHGAHGSHITWLGQRLVAHGYGRYYRVGPGPNWSNADRKNVAAFQRAQGWSGSGADGYPGPKTLQRLAR